MYCPAGFVDDEDGSGNVIPGLWRDTEDSSGLEEYLVTGTYIMCIMSLV